MKKKLSILLLAGMMIMTVAGIGMAGEPEDSEIGNPAMVQEQLQIEDAECDGDCDGDMLQTQTRQQLRDGSGDGEGGCTGEGTGEYAGEGAGTMARKQTQKQLKTGECDGTGQANRK